jgi:hypothetical protein
MKYCFGVQSKNSIDALIEFSLINPNIDITIIPSRRQVDYLGGYVNNWTTKTFTEYIKTQNPNIKIERDHSGPNQGYNEDDGYESLTEDCKYFNIIHIDPWKKYQNFADGCNETINMINFCYQQNPTIEFEIGTEEAIRPFTVEELEELILILQNTLNADIFKQIKWLVIQSGTRLCEGKNIGCFNENKLKNMLHLSNKYNFLSKEHNGDWLTMNNIKKKKKMGLNVINIAPELGMIESNIIINNIKGNEEWFNCLYNICFKSNLWKKWVSKDFDSLNNKEDVIRFSCHYHFTNNDVIEIKNKISGIDNEIKRNVFLRLIELYQLY